MTANKFVRDIENFKPFYHVTLEDFFSLELV